MLILDKIEYKAKSIKWEKTEHFIMIKCLIQEMYNSLKSLYTNQ